jgi:very-short-patch-repair endonuclease
VTLTHQLAGVATDRVVQIRGADAGHIAQAVAAGSADLAVVVKRSNARWTTPREFVDAMVDDLERVAVELVPAWLPEASDVHRVDVGGVAAVRMIAAARAAQTRYTRSFLLDLALLAVTGHRDDRPGLSAGRAAQLARLIAESFGRTRCVLVVPLPTELAAAERESVVAGGGWLTHNAKMAVWLVGATPVDVDRVPVASLHDVPSARMAPIGKPHPASAVEAALEAALAVESWAGGREWNQNYQSTSLSAPVRLDLVWARERCVVEIDGPEHCHPVHFEADRQRDVQLQLDGYAVLRFTNARVVHDVGAVVHQIGTYIRGRRRETVEGP